VVNMEFEIKGTAVVKENTQTFSKRITAQSKKHAEEIVLASLGSNYKIPRRNIKILEIAEVKK